MRKILRSIALAIPLTFLPSVAAHADSLTFTLIQPTESTPFTSTNTLSYVAEVSAPVTNTAAIDLNGDTFNLTGPLTLDDTDYIVDFPLSLNPGDSFTYDLFTILVPAGTPIGDYTGSFTLLGGPTNSSFDPLGTVNFTTAVTPEASTFVLLGTGAVGILGLGRRALGRF
jgi:hypothetical protein